MADSVAVPAKRDPMSSKSVPFAGDKALIDPRFPPSGGVKQKVVNLLGETLIRDPEDEENLVSTQSISTPGLVIGLYFSAQWCGPCRLFTPKLEEFYRKINEKEKRLEVVFVSLDDTKQKFNQYFSKMPWLSLPYIGAKEHTEGVNKRLQLRNLFGVSGIPTLILIDGCTGVEIRTDGTRKVLQDPNGLQFPWSMQGVSELLAGPLLRNTSTSAAVANAGDTDKTLDEGTEVVESSDMQQFEKVLGTEVLKHKYRAVYFSAQWCRPCHAFTAHLISMIKLLAEQGKQLDIILCSTDTSDASFSEYFSTHPWLAIPFEDKERMLQLNELLGVKTIPCLTILDNEGHVLCPNARSVVSMDQTGAMFPWQKPLVEELNQLNFDQIETKSAVVFFTDGIPELMTKAIEVLLPLAEEFAHKHPNLIFFYTGEDDVAGALCEYFSLHTPAPHIGFLVMSRKQKMVCEQVDNAREFLMVCLNGVYAAEKYSYRRDTGSAQTASITSPKLKSAEIADLKIEEENDSRSNCEDAACDTS